VRLLTLARRALAEVVVLGGETEILVTLLVELALGTGGLDAGDRVGVADLGAVVGTRDLGGELLCV
jgi:hypothetical protein